MYQYMYISFWKDNCKDLEISGDAELSHRGHCLRYPGTFQLGSARQKLGVTQLHRGKGIFSREAGWPKTGEFFTNQKLGVYPRVI